MTFVFLCTSCKTPCGHEGEPGIHFTPLGWLCTPEYEQWLSTVRRKIELEEEEMLYNPRVLTNHTNMIEPEVVIPDEDEETEEVKPEVEEEEAI